MVSLHLLFFFAKNPHSRNHYTQIYNLLWKLDTCLTTVIATPLCGPRSGPCSQSPQAATVQGRDAHALAADIVEQQEQILKVKAVVLAKCRVYSQATVAATMRALGSRWADLEIAGCTLQRTVTVKHDTPLPSPLRPIATPFPCYWVLPAGINTAS